MAERASLRRLDWRFLLPAPPDGIWDHLVLLGGPPGLAECARQGGLARRVSVALPPDRSADAVAVLYDADISPEDAARCLTAAGALYLEVDRRQRGSRAVTAGRVEGALRAAGLTPTGSYWAAPDFAACKRFLPLDAPAALRWYLDALFVEGTPGQRLLAWGAGQLARRGGRPFASLARCFAVTACAGEARPPSVLGHPGLPAGLQGAALRPLLLTSGQDDGSRAVMLPFATSSTQPAAVLKIAPRADFNANTEREQAILADLQARLDATLRPTVPQPLGVARYGALAVGMEGCAPGRSLWASSGRWRATLAEQRDDLQLGARWLTRFHRQAQVGRVTWGEAARAQWVEELLATYQRGFGLSENEARLFQQLRARAEELDGATLPIVPLHYDFAPWNLFRAGDHLTVIDWEFGRNWERDRNGPALGDLLYFVTYWTFVTRRLHSEAAEVRGLHDLFVAPDGDARTRAVHETLAAYMAAVEMDRRFVPLLLVTTWAEQALHRLHRKQRLGQPQREGREHNRCVRYVELLATHADTLFGGALEAALAGVSNPAPHRARPEALVKLASRPPSRAE